MTGGYRLAPGEPTALAAVSEVLAQAHQIAGGQTVPTSARTVAGVHADTFFALLNWYELAGDDPEAAYERGMSLPAGSNDRDTNRLRRAAKRLRRPHLETLTRVAIGLGCRNPSRVAELAASRAPSVVLDFEPVPS